MDNVALIDICSEVEEVSIPLETAKLDVLILAAGFEDRAFKVLPEGNFKNEAHCVIIKFVNSIAENDNTLKVYLTAASERFNVNNIHIVELHHDNPESLGPAISGKIKELP